MLVYTAPLLFKLMKENVENSSFIAMKHRQIHFHVYVRHPSNTSTLKYLLNMSWHYLTKLEFDDHVSDTREHKV